MEIKISIESRKEFVRKLVDSLFEVWHNSKLYVNTNDENYIIAQCFVQAFILKTQAILKLTEGVRYYSGSETLLIDPTSMYPIFRSFYEHYIMFHSLFVQEREKDAREVLVLLWKIAGESNKVGIKNSPKKFNLNKETSSAYIEHLKKRVIGKIELLNASPRAKNILLNKVNSGFTKCNAIVLERDSQDKIIEVKVFQFCDYAQYIFENKELQDIYTVLSVDSHPTNIGIEHFGQMFNHPELLEDLLANILDSCLILIQKAINAYTEAFECKQVLELLSQEVKGILQIKC